jgi:putative ABC transport system permease protein
MMDKVHALRLVVKLQLRRWTVAEGVMMDSLLQDLRYAARQMTKSPGFTLAAVLSLAIGIGLNTAVFSGMDAVVLRPLALPRLDRVVTVAEQRTSGTEEWVALANYQDWVRNSHAFAELAVRKDTGVALTGDGDAEQIAASFTSASFFPALGIKAQLGRVYREDESRPGHDSAAVLNYGFWQRRFGGDPAVLGHKIELDQHAYTVVGVMPKSMEYPSTTDVYLPLAARAEDLADRKSHDYQVVGRLKDGVTVTQAQAEMRIVADQLARQYPGTNQSWSVHVAPLLDVINGPYTPAYYRMMLGGTLFVLMVVCANVANLQLARGIARRPEIAMRNALGATRWRVLRQLLTENILLGLAGALGGLAFGELCLHMIVAAMPARVARFVAGWSNMKLDGRAFAFSLLLAGLAGVVAGLAPAIDCFRVNAIENLKAGSRAATGSGRSHRLRNFFAVAQIALAVSLVIGATLIGKGLNSWFHLPDRFRPNQTLTFNLTLPATRYATAEQRSNFYAATLVRLRTLPGVTHAEMATALPYDDNGWVRDVEIEKRPASPGKLQSAYYLPISDGYFDGLGIPVIAGRAFHGDDSLLSEPVAIVSERFVREYFPGEDPLGHHIRMGRDKGEPWMTIVGVAKETDYSLWDPTVHPAVYVSSIQAAPASTGFILTTNRDPILLAPSAHAAIAHLDPLLPVDAMETYSQLLRDNLVGLMYAAAMLAFDGAFALFLAAMGIFAVMSNLVMERKREIGVRLALGALRENVLKLMLARAGRLVVTGLAIGLVSAFFLAIGLRSLLQGVEPNDPWVFSGVAGVIASVALLSSWLPARRAVRADPMAALRDE